MAVVMTAEDKDAIRRAAQIQPHHPRLTVWSLLHRLSLDLGLTRASRSTVCSGQG
jgi:hypothetical protein